MNSFQIYVGLVLKTLDWWLIIIGIIIIEKISGSQICICLCGNVFFENFQTYHKALIFFADSNRIENSKISKKNNFQDKKISRKQKIQFLAKADINFPIDQRF
jgi:hypothetical protein